MNENCSLMLIVMFMILGMIKGEFGICYDPLHDLEMYHRQGPAAVFKKDFNLLRKHFKAVRTFSILFNNVPIGPFIRDAGMLASLGIHIETGDTIAIDREIQAAIKEANDPSQYVRYIFVGAESLMRYTHDSNRIAGYIHYIKSQVPEHVKVGTVQRPSEWMSSDEWRYPGLGNMIAASDVIGADLYPFFTRLDNGMDSGASLITQWHGLQRYFGNKQIVITGTGWPSSGGHNYIGNNWADISNANAYAAKVVALWDENKLPTTDAAMFYYFQAFDQPYKFNENAFEASFGLFWSTGEPKIGMKLPHVQEETRY